MENPRAEKVAVVDEVRERFESSRTALLTEYRGLDVAAISELRRAVRAAGGDYKVYKNTLVRLAVRQLDLDVEELLLGPTAIAFITEKPDGSPAEAVDVAKALKDFAKTNPALVVKGGILDMRPLSLDDARSLADIEPREVLLSRLAGAMAAPMQQLAGLMQALPRDLAYGLKALIDQQGGVPAEEVGEAEAAGASEESAAAAETSDSPDSPEGADSAETSDEPDTDDTPNEAPAADASDEATDTQE